MKPSVALNRAATLAAAVSLFLAPALLLTAQSTNDKKAPSPPPQNSVPAKPAPAPVPQQRVPQPQTRTMQQPQTHAVQPRPAGPKVAMASPPKNSSPRNLPPNPSALKPGPAPVKTKQPAAPYVARHGETVTKAPGGETVYRNPNGEVVRTNSRGQLKQIVAPRGLAGNDKIVVNHAPGGVRVVEAGHPGNRVVSYSPHRGFVESPLRPGYISRTYVYGGHSYVRVYREYKYRNIVYYHYVPANYYGPRFYGWVATPWSAPAVYVWHRGFAAPWYGFYAGYFTPSPTYASPDLWLTDYVLAENLRLAYESQQAANPDQAPPSGNDPQGSSAPLSPDVKAEIAEEVRNQLAAENADASQRSSASPEHGEELERLPPAMSQKFFVVSSSLELTTKDGVACSLTPGDVIERKGGTVDQKGGVATEVVSSKQGDCPADSSTDIQLTDLQDMHNQLREQLDSGLSVLAKNDAKGLPTAPPSEARSVAEGSANPAPNAAAQLITQDADASKLETQVRQD